MVNFHYAVQCGSTNTKTISYMAFTQLLIKCFKKFISTAFIDSMNAHWCATDANKFFWNPTQLIDF